MKSRVAIVDDKNCGRGISRALTLLDNLAPLFAGRDVVIKPNETWASEEDLTACTQADALQATIRAIKKYKPRKITVSGGSGGGDTGAIFALLGFDSVIRKEGVGFFDHNKPPFVTVPLVHGPQKDVVVNSRVVAFETVVSLAQLKVHHLAAVTLSMKNVAMSFPAADHYGHPRAHSLRPHLFFEDLHGFIAGMCHRFPFALAIVVGHPAMIGKGPIGGTTFEAGLTIAGTDFVAVDAVSACLLGKTTVHHIAQAAALGLGTDDLAQIELAGIGLEDGRRLFQERARANAECKMKNAE